MIYSELWRFCGSVEKIWSMCTIFKHRPNGTMYITLSSEIFQLEVFKIVWLKALSSWMISDIIIFWYIHLYIYNDESRQLSIKKTPFDTLVHVCLEYNRLISNTFWKVKMLEFYSWCYTIYMLHLLYMYMLLKSLSTIKGTCTVQKETYSDWSLTW